ncbi:MAG: PGPGW domain-containing protein [Acidimicrobiia bacterium]
MSEPKRDRFDLDGDGTVTDMELALAPTAPLWRKLGLRGPLIVLRWVGRNAKRMAVAVLGLAVVAAGVAMLALPGPGVLVIIVGLAILATEFVWAERALNYTTNRAAKAATTVTGSSAGRGLLAVSGIGLIVAGAVVFVVVERFRTAGVGLAIAGVVGLGTLMPVAQRWLDRQLAAPAELPGTEQLDDAVDAQ